MSIKRHSTEAIVNKLRQMDVELAKGQSVAAVCKLIGIHEQTYYRWRKDAKKWSRGESNPRAVTTGQPPLHA